MHLKDLRKYMTHTNCFTRAVVSSAISKMRGEPDCGQYYSEAGKLLRFARANGEIRYIENRKRSCYYDFSTPNA